jgi:hypothetical protein
LVFSPLNFPKASHMASSTDFIGAGVKSTVDSIPAGWSQLFLLSASNGINDGMMAWGDRMLKYDSSFRQKLALEDVIGSDACLLEASMRVTNSIPLGCSLFLPVHTINCVQTLKVHWEEAC